MSAQHTPEPTRYAIAGKYLQEQPNGEYIKACHYDAMKQQRDELKAQNAELVGAMIAAVNTLNDDAFVDQDHEAIFMLNRAIAKVSV